MRSSLILKQRWVHSSNICSIHLLSIWWLLMRYSGQKEMITILTYRALIDWDLLRDTLRVSVTLNVPFYPFAKRVPYKYFPEILVSSHLQMTFLKKWVRMNSVSYFFLKLQAVSPILSVLVQTQLHNHWVVMSFIRSINTSFFHHCLITVYHIWKRNDARERRVPLLLRKLFHLSFLYDLLNYAKV